MKLLLRLIIKSHEVYMNILTIQAKKQQRQKITMLTCYDACFARLLDDTSLDIILVGDSLAMVMHGHANTVGTTLDMMTMHTTMVAKQVTQSLLVVDMPFLSYHQGEVNTMTAVQSLMQAGAHAIKIEGCHPEILNTIQFIVAAGVPVMGHLGLTPQSLHQLGGFKVQAKTETAAQQLQQQALALQQAGCFALVLECVPAQVAATITASVTIPTIGIGAGKETDGQVLVLHDMLGFNREFKAKFVKHYLPGADLVSNAIEQYIAEVKQQTFPTPEHSY